MTTQAASCRTRVALQNVGCKLNNYEVEALKNGFHGRGYEIVPFEAEADIYVVNTCTVTLLFSCDAYCLKCRRFFR